MSACKIDKFFCCIPLRAGAITFGSLGIVGSLLQLLVTTIFWSSSASRYRYTTFLDYPRRFMCIYPFHVVVCVLYVIFAIMLIIGAIAKKYVLVKIYFCYAFIHIILMLALTMTEYFLDTTYPEFILGIEIAILVASQFGIKGLLEDMDRIGVFGHVIRLAEENPE